MTDPIPDDAPIPAKGAPPAAAPINPATYAAGSPESPPAANSVAAWPSVTVRLSFPLPLPGGGEIATLEFAEPDLEALERIEAAMGELGISEAAEEFKLAVRHARPLIWAFTGIDREILKRLHRKDVTAALIAIAPLLEGLAT